MARRTVDVDNKNKRNLSAARTLALLAIFFASSAGPIVALDPTSHISQYGHSVWRVQDGYFGGGPSVITQTTDGYIWVGTDAGLFRFDGVRFVRWSPSSGEELPSSRIYDLRGARDGSLWIGSDSGLAHLVNNRLILYQKSEGWVVTNIFEDRDGKIWFMRIRPDDKTHPLCQVLDTGVRCYGSKDGVDVFAGGAIAQGPSGELWVGGSTTFVRWRPAASKVYRPKALESNEGNGGVRALLPATDGSLWVGMNLAGPGAGLQHMVNGTLKPFLAPNLNGETQEVNALCSDRQNSLWVGTTQGLYRIRGTEVDHYGSADGLSSDYVLEIFEDREGDVWVTTSRGIDMFRDLRVKSISKREGLADSEVESVAASRNGNVWIGTVRLQVLGPRGVSLFGPGKRLPGNLVTSLFTDHAGRLWAGMINRLFVYERGSFREITKQDGGALGMVMGIAEDSEHNIWVESAGPPGTLFLIQDLRVRQWFPAPSIPLARKVVADPQGGIWLGLVTGDLARYRDGQVNTFTFGDHPNSRVLALTAASDGSILGGTVFGVVGWKNGKQQMLTVQNGLPCNTVNALISDDAGDLWLYAQCGLIEIPKEQIQLWWEHPESRLRLTVFDILDGAQAGWAPFNTSAKTPDGRLWFTNSSVVQVIDPAHLAENTFPPPVDISDLVADRKSYSLESAIHLPPQTRDLEIDYTALSFVAPQKVLFRYMLEGHDAGWQEPGARRQAFYNDLHPGAYRFRVIACNNDGVWNEAGASLNFSILPAYYQTAWFRVACGAAFLGSLWAIYQLRVQQLRRQFNIGVEARVNERTRIAQEFHDTLLQGFISASMQLGVADRQLPADWPAKPIVSDVLKLMRDVIEEGRKAVRGMRLSGGDSDDLEQAFSRIPQELVVHRAVGFRVLVEGQVRPLHPLIRDEVYRIGREALVNAFHHSEAASVEVELEYADRELRVLVRDNGCGIDPQVLQSGREGHWGLSGMRERAGRVGARLKVWSDAAAGTEVELSVPGRVAYRPDASPRSLEWFAGLGRRKGGDHAQKPGHER